MEADSAILAAVRLAVLPGVDMAIDASLYGQFGQKPISYYDAMKEIATAQDDQTTVQFNRLKLMQQQQEMESAKANAELQARIRQAYTQLGPNATAQDRARIHQGMGDWAGADAIIKADAELGGKRAETEKKAWEVSHGKLTTILNLLDGVKTPEQWAQRRGMAQQMGIPLDGVPEAFNPQYVESMRGAALTAIQRLEQENKDREFGLKSANEPFKADGSPNVPVQQFQTSKARAGATSVAVNSGQKGFENERGLRGDFKAEPVYKAYQEMQSAHGQIVQSLEQATPVGDLAAATKIMKLLDPGSVVRESELGMAMAASGLLDRITNYGNMIVTGQKLTPTQRKEFRALADKLYSESVNQYNNKRNEYLRLGGEYGINADRAVGPSAKSPVLTKQNPGLGGDLISSELASQIEAEAKRRGLK